MTFLKDGSLLRAQAFVDGVWCDAATGSDFAVTNPATGETVGRVPDMDGAGADRAIAAADAAFPAWAAKTAKDRAAILRRRTIWPP